MKNEPTREQLESAGDVRFAVNPHLRIVFVSDDEVMVRHSGRSPTSRTLRDDGGTKLLGTVLRALATFRSRAELEAETALAPERRDELASLIDYLEGEQIVVREGRDVVGMYLQSILGGRKPLQQVRVALVGAGHLGSRIAEQLVRLGVGSLQIIDERRVLNPDVDARFFALPRALLAEHAAYAELLARHLQSIGGAEVVASTDSNRDKAALRRLCTTSDCVVFASEHPGSLAFHAMNEAALEVGTPWMAVTMDGSEAVVGPLFVPGQSACYNEFQVQIESSCWGVKDEFLTYREAMSRGDLGPEHLCLPSYCDIAAGLAATALARYLIGGKAFLMGRSIRYDFERLTVDTEEVLRLPRCPACAPMRAYRHSYL